MPVYDYKCKDHGIFNELATMDESSNPCACPECGVMCARVIMIAPEIFGMDKDKKHAHELNERNQHEPTVSTKDRRESDEQHSRGCGCEKKLSPPKMFLTDKGEKFFPSARPWMISH